MISWKNTDELASFKKLGSLGHAVKLTEVMAGEAGAKRVHDYSVPMAC